jgi:hypothetical protein
MGAGVGANAWLRRLPPNWPEGAQRIYEDVVEQQLEAALGIYLFDRTPRRLRRGLTGLT